MDDAAVRRTQAQLTRWGEEIKRREARLLTPGREPRFEAVVHVDELRIMLVTASAGFAVLQAGSTGRHDLQADGFDHACQELAAAIAQQMPRP
jgi:hypothetical protein